jgi:hypothetical protein
MNQGGQVASVIKDHVQGSITFEAGKSLLDAPRILFLSFTFPGEDWNTSRGNATYTNNQVNFLKLIKHYKDLRSRSMILGRKDILKQTASAIS